MLKKCLIAMMLAAGLVVVIPASMATAAPRSDTAVATPQNLDSTQIRMAGGILNLRGHEVKAIANLGGLVSSLVVLQCPSVIGFPITTAPIFRPPVPKGVSLIGAICRGVGKDRAIAVVAGIMRMSTLPGRLPVGDNQCFQFRVQRSPIVPVIVSPIGNC